MALSYQYRLLTYLPWGDEAETIVVAKMIAAGERLYSEIFNHHGPLVFVPATALELVGSFGVTGHRVVVALMQWATVLAIAYSPLLTGLYSRMLSCCCSAAVMLLYLPEDFGHTYQYQTVAGLTVVVALVQYTLPAIVCPEEVSTRRVALGNALITSLPFLAVTYAPLAIILFAVSTRGGWRRPAILWALGAMVSNLCLLALMGSVRGYLAYHFYLNSTVLPRFNGGQSPARLVETAFRTATANLGAFALISFLVAALVRLSSREKRFPWRSLGLAIGLGSLLIRGDGVHGLVYHYSLTAMTCALFMGNLGNVLDFQGARVVPLGLLLVCMVKFAAILPGDKDRFDRLRVPPWTGFARLAEYMTTPADRVLAYSFQNFEYIASNRLPVTGHFFYLPWQKAYNESPVLGIKTDPCVDIRNELPKVAMVDQWKVWNRFEWSSYGGCVQDIMDSLYARVPNTALHIRSDLLTANPGLADRSKLGKLEPSAPLSAENALKLHVSPPSQTHSAPLKRLGVRIATHQRENRGQARLSIQSETSTIPRDVNLLELVDGAYAFFEVSTSNPVTGGSIEVVSGDGISLWEWREGDTISTCVVFEYADGKYQYVPGCPVY